MPIGGSLRLLKGVLYRLKRSYGCPLAVYQQTPQVLDFTTGRASVTIISYSIERAIVLPSQIHRGYTYSAGEGATNFKYGGIYTDANREIIIDRKDLPKELILDASDKFYIVYQNQRWEIKEVREFEFKLAYSIILARVDGAIVNEIHNQCIRDLLTFTENFQGGTPEDEYLNVNNLVTFSQTIGLRFVRALPIRDKLIFTEELEIP